MLVLSRRKNESLLIGENVELLVVDVRGDKVRLGINAPADIAIVRKEILAVPCKPASDSVADASKLPPLLISLRDARSDDLLAINDIYNGYVLNSTCTYQEQTDTIEAREEWFARKIATGMPVIVAEFEGRVIGWGSLAPFKERSGYRFTVDDAVYLLPDYHRRGVGTALLGRLIELARAKSFRSIMAIIDAEQAGSIAIHSKLGFRRVGQLSQAGFKFGRWLDTVYMQLVLPPSPTSN